ncbi:MULTISPECIES: asparaginase [Actinomadura]|uniref:L-asparaginase II n=1 Tax=Actinomadura madurae TaxID=1993 RepID=A0A1I5G4I6_9ACTN|nr:asparaginase [Actinomadura madurae]SFO30907.1 L-asparaginase II [Actinomadura madurae]SPT50988.1 L-asparaginase II [Actinomadura madurae]
MTINPVLVEVERSGFVESRHRGAAIGIDAGGAVAVRAGDPAAPVFPRSANKPLQAVAMLRSGLELDDELLALAAGSHSGEDFHMEGVEKILSAAGLVAADLRCPESWPLDPATQHDIARTGRGPSRPRMNCSGKHAAMLATCVTAGWPTGTYLDPGHPLQRAVRDVVEEMAGEDVTAVGVDGCGAPLFAVSIAGVARAFRALVLAGPGTPERRVADAMRTHPQWTSGTRREELRLMEAVPGLLVKCGAEGVDAFAFGDGRAGAVKIDDGAMRARTPVTVALLRALGVHDGADKAALDELAVVEVRGGDGVVGAIRPSPGAFDQPSSGCRGSWTS